MPKHPDRMMELRQRTGMKQEEMAVLLNTSRSAIANYESNGRPLPDAASFYYAHLLIEMSKPENQLATAPAADGNTLQQWKKELQQIAAENRYQAERLQRKITAFQQKQTAFSNRQLLRQCAEKVLAQLLAQQDGNPWQPITERHKKWLELERTFSNIYHISEQEYLQHLRDRFSHDMFIKEAEEAERLMSDL